MSVKIKRKQLLRFVLIVIHINNIAVQIQTELSRHCNIRIQRFIQGIPTDKCGHIFVYFALNILLFRIGQIHIIGTNPRVQTIVIVADFKLERCDGILRIVRIFTD